MKSICVVFSLFLASLIHAETSEKIGTIRIEIDDEALAIAPWLNATDFIIVRDVDDPALKWFEKLSGKSLRSDLAKGPILLFNGFDDPEFFLSRSGGSVFLNIDSLRHRDIYSTALMVTAAGMPNAKDLSFYRIRKVEEDTSRLGHQSEASLGK